MAALFVRSITRSFPRGPSTFRSIGGIADVGQTSNPFFGSSNLAAVDRVKVVLLENIHPHAVAAFKAANFDVHTYDHALSGDELLEVAGDCHILGIRSKTQLSDDFFEKIGNKQHRLWAIGCFCIGTNQVALDSAARSGVTVFNAPFSNTRSVAEKTIAEAIALKRRLFERSMQLHRGQWQKSALQSHEVRGMTLGIVGYGRIGSQVSVLAETMGMKVVFYDVSKRLELGNAVQLDTLEELLSASDVVTLHVPGERTDGFIGSAELAKMKPGAALINNARGRIIDIEALKEALVSGHLAGAAVDVFPEEPSANTERGGFDSPLIGMDNVILTPHIGGSTVEAQENIAKEVATKLIHVITHGSTTTCCNLPEVELSKPTKDVHRILHLHHNKPGVMSDINACVADMGANITGQILKTDESVGYVILDVERDEIGGYSMAKEVKQRIQNVPHTIWVRSLLRSSGKWGHPRLGHENSATPQN